jgi:CHAT domain-containing protein
MTKLEQATYYIENLQISDFFNFMKQNTTGNEMLVHLEKAFILGKTDVDFYARLKSLANLLLTEKQIKKTVLMNNPTILMAFAKNDLPGVKTEAENIYKFVQSNSLVKALKIEDTNIDTLANSIIDNIEDLFMFHYGGHADQNNVVLDGFRNLDKIRLSRLLLPNENHNLSIVFLNGCLTYGQVGLLTAKGVKVIIATNVSVDDSEVIRLSSFFYKCFFEKKYTLKSAFQTAEATVEGVASHVHIVNPGEIDENQPMPSSWALFVHSKYKEVLDWRVEDFAEKK